MSRMDTASGNGEGPRPETGGAMGTGSDVYQFDFLQCTIPDIHGIPRGRLIPKGLIPRVLREGFGLCQVTGSFGFNMEIPMQIEEFTNSGFANSTSMPTPNTARPLLWGSTPDQKLGHTFCTLLLRDGQPDPVCTRHTALRQLERLDKMGMKIKSAFEMEFMVYENGDVSRPMGGGKKQFSNMDLLDEHLSFFMELIDTLRGSGVPVEFFNNEAEDGQYELTIEPTYGVESADATFLARCGIRAFCRRRGYSATFMTRPVHHGFGNGFHFNHSLWTKDDKDVFFDASDPTRLSALAHHWIGGLLHHAPALCALYCPTVNCYKRLRAGFAPSTVYWNLEDRFCTFRAKTSNTGTYLENRLPSSACNPYLTLAATIAAGLDGVERKLECPDPGLPAKGKEAGPALPKSLGEALDLLQKDTVLKEALGSKVVDYFTVLKRDFEIKHFENNTSKDMSLAEVIEVERKYYMPYL